jgi:uncharacterized membrane protein YdjX (TVP38/TMEM64 family)
MVMNPLDNEQRRQVWIRSAALATVIAVLATAAIAYAPAITRLIANTARFAEYLKSFGIWGVAVFMLIQAVQVIISPIPGELTQLAGGFVYGTAAGSIYSSLGIMGGAIAAFFIARLFGYPLIRLLAPAKVLDKFNFLINNPKAELGILVLFLIPGVPKDILTYIAGLTPLKPLRFFIASTVARFPGILLSSFIGAHVESKDYTEVIVASLGAIVLFIIGVLFQDRIIQRFKHPGQHP